MGHMMAAYGELDRLRLSDAELLVFPGLMLEWAAELMERARNPGTCRATLLMQSRHLAAADAMLTLARLHARGFREFVATRNALAALMDGRRDLVEQYTRERLRLPRAFPQYRQRVRGEPLLTADAVAEALWERRWTRPPACTAIAQSIRTRAWQFFHAQRCADEQEHIRAGEHGVIIRSLTTTPPRASGLTYDAQVGVEPPRVAATDLRVDLADAMRAIEAEPEFTKVMNALLLEQGRWADFSDDKHYSTKFRRDFAPTFRRLAECLADYRPPITRPTLEARWEALNHNTPGYHARNKKWPD